ncbi:signal recognition particle, SRP9/SRP14 subunit [Aspergillus ellipticus CBS 707.79]|uniref:Signal recognition particle subunit SRP14 n=1 Tax=Aspergillus ellipticus CBS 707.79 TaxID=1448320 RepID=A0A319EYS7_9EURO|nr:signal recognition particle, SRP9/SRP14 subunit [Aspergillus ellipticus CBS 707.79]
MPAHLGHDEFFTSLTTLLTTTSTKTRGSVYLTQKPLPPSTTTDSTTTTPSILIRATDGNTSAPNPKTHQGKTKSKAAVPKTKLSTVVNPDQLEAFYARYAEVCKAGMSGLKKRDRKKGKAKGKGGAAGGVAGGKVTKA